MTLPSPRVAIVLVNWNGLQDTVDCIESCDALDYPNFEIVVVDNGSTDGSREALRARFPELPLVESDADLGFAGGCNLGIRHALDNRAEYIWLLNNDTKVDPQALSALVDALGAHPEAAIAGSKILFFDPPDVISFAGGGFTRFSGRTFHRGDGEVDHGQYDDEAETDFSTGASILVRSNVVRSVGLIDERYFLYWEDVDWCERIRLAGWTIRYVPRSVVWHKVGATTPNDRAWAQGRYEGRNRVQFYQRVHPRRWLLVAAFALVNAAYLLVRGRPKSAGAMARGVMDAFARRTGPISEG